MIIKKGGKVLFSDKWVDVKSTNPAGGIRTSCGMYLSIGVTDKYKIDGVEYSEYTVDSEEVGRHTGPCGENDIVQPRPTSSIVRATRQLITVDENAKYSDEEIEMMIRHEEIKASEEIKPKKLKKIYKYEKAIGTSTASKILSYQMKDCMKRWGDKDKTFSEWLNYVEKYNPILMQRANLCLIMPETGVCTSMNTFVSTITFGASTKVGYKITKRKKGYTVGRLSRLFKTKKDAEKFIKSDKIEKIKMADGISISDGYKFLGEGESPRIKLESEVLGHIFLPWTAFDIMMVKNVYHKSVEFYEHKFDECVKRTVTPGYEYYEMW